jgi:glycosyltransferase involved in cell wall biosynthesis
LSEKWIPKGDIVIATAWRTAEWVSRYSKSIGIGYYLIQGLETWCGTEEKIFDTWKAPLNKITISKWLLDIVTSLGEKASYIPNGLSMDEFQVDISPEKRDPKRILMLYHEGAWKGSSDGIEALKLVRQQDPDVKAALFGVSPRPDSLPEWIEYYRDPPRRSLRELYNQAAIFVSPSWSEGWGLPPSEAMLCGAALVATDIGGHREYAFHEKTALLSPIRDPQRLADNITRLVYNPALRLRLANNGHEYIKQFSWEVATNLLESLLCKSGF